MTSSTTKNLVYFGQTPGFGTGSPIVIFRHLKRLVAEGWTVDAFVERGQNSDACQAAGITPHILPLRRPWWPPYNKDSKISKAIRLRLMVREAKRILSFDSKNTVCLSYLSIHSHEMAELATAFSANIKRPLLTIVHDDTTAFDFGKEPKDKIIEAHTQILSGSTACLFVSKELSERFDIDPKKKKVLLPIPEGYSPSAERLEPSAPIKQFFYAGRLWSQQLPLFADIARTLNRESCCLNIIATPSDELSNFCKEHSIKLHTPFPTNVEALDFMKKEADAMIVAYSRKMEDMEWIRTSFPSKLVEYSHLKIPLCVIAPQDSSVGTWLNTNSPSLLIRPDDTEGLSRFASDIKASQRKEQRTEELRKLAIGLFSPDSIHDAFKKMIREATQAA